MNTRIINEPMNIGESFKKFMRGFDENSSQAFQDVSWEMRDGHYVQFSLYQDQKRSIAETNETFSARL
ncbi:MAG: hypothetical protein IJ524_07675 [Bacteroidales bacterium]|nr:hypothetical protein [Bacteroidales bacterium]